ncbi:unnamed protein product, partial [Laminaria digitata]
MPAQRIAAKRKAPEAGHAPLSSSKAKRRPVTDGASKSTTARTAGTAAAASRVATKFMTGLANHLASDDMGQGTAAIEGALRAAVGALPKGKLKTELAKDEALTVERLVAEVRAVKAKKQAASAADAGPGEAQADVVPCTVELYGRARRVAEEGSSGGAAGSSGGSGNRSSLLLLRSLALNPRAPLDLLVKAMGTDDANNARSGTAVATLESGVGGLRSLVKALAADPRSAVSASGVAFYANRAADLAAAILAALTKEEAFGSGDGNAAAVATAAAAVAVATEGLGLILRVLQLAGLAVSAAALSSTPPLASDGGGGRLADPAGALLLSCLPKTTSITTAGAGAGAATARGAGGEGAAAAAAGGGVEGAARSLPPARVSVARLLAHYAAAMAACSAGWKGGAAVLVKGARSAAAVAGEKRGGDGNESSSSSSSSSDESDDERGDGGGALGRHLSALSAGHLSGNETATLEFLRCVGDAAFPAACGSGSRSGHPRQVALPVAAAASLAPTCARVLARLPRPSASPPPTAAQFLKRAYAFRVVEALGQAATACRFKGANSGGGGRGRSRDGGGNAPGIGGDTSAVRPWDFVGAAAAPVALLDFLGRPEAPLAVGGGAAGTALKELASRRRKPAAVAELLRFSAACAPASLGPLLAAMEKLGGAEEAGGGGGGGGGEGEVGGFFVDTGAAAAVGEAGSGLVLAPIGTGEGVVADMDEE